MADIRGRFVTIKEIAAYYSVSVWTMREKIKPYKVFLAPDNQRKRLYSPSDVEFILKVFGPGKAG